MGRDSSPGFHTASVETRTDGLDGVDGLNTVYAVAVSPDSRHVYAAGFGDNAVPSFIVGTGSSCSASGGGDIDDLVDLGRGGTLVYRVTARIRPEATGYGTVYFAEEMLKQQSAKIQLLKRTRIQRRRAGK
mgnify:CR=1 FL=1